jgi:predicted Zn-dependent protease with MMP-like domain
VRPLPLPVFEGLVADALDQVPPDLLALMDNVVVLVEDRNADEPDLLGLYEGYALTERGWEYGGALPDRIMVYREAICDICSTAEEVVEEVTITVVHEIAHHFGIDDERPARARLGREDPILLTPRRLGASLGMGPSTYLASS